jgi:diguanylate cyclase
MKRGMLWKKKKAPETAVESETGPAEAPADEPRRDAADKALDAVTMLVRLYGKHAFDTDMEDASAIQARCDDWATRISLGPPRPGTRESTDGRAAEARGAGAFRDWTGLISFMRDHRRAESDYVTRSLDGFRDAVLCFASCMGKAMAEERERDTVLEERIGTLRHAIDKRDSSRIVAEAERMVTAVREAMDERRRREDEEVRLLGEHVRDLRIELSEARKKAEIDALTQLSNRAAFDSHVLQLVALGALLGKSPWLCLVDLDHFKAINDNYGHPAGDEVLRQVSNCLSRTFLRKQDFVSRYGGEEFAAVLLDTTREQMLKLTQRLMDGVRDLVVRHDGREVKVTLSLGLAELHRGESVASWLGRADAALYRAKREGRDRYCIEP